MADDLPFRLVETAAVLPMLELRFQLRFAISESIPVLRLHVWVITL